MKNTARETMATSCMGKPGPSKDEATRGRVHEF
jgi:hypothetical protein